MSFYAIAKGKQTGIFNSWAECKSYTDGYTNAIFKKFNNKEDAETFIENMAKREVSVSKKIDDNVNKIPTKTPPINKIGESTFEPDYYVYTDGACSNNGKENALAGIGIYFGENDTRNVSMKITGKQSNNTAELGAILQLYNIIDVDILSGKKIGIVSDSLYAIRCATSYGKKCEEKGWIEDIPNKDIVKEVYELYKDISNIQFLHIMAHTENTDIHSKGNDGADKLANKAIGLDECPYKDVKNRVYLVVPFIKKDLVKRLGGKWDVSKKQWYIYSNADNKEEVLSHFPFSPSAGSSNTHGRSSS